MAWVAEAVRPVMRTGSFEAISVYLGVLVTRIARRPRPRPTAAAAANPNGTGAHPGEPCDFQTYWGAQHMTDAVRIRGVIDALDALGVRNNTFVVFSTGKCPACSTRKARAA